MMKSIITEKGITFKDLEKKIYTWVCRIGQEFTREFLERYDQVLMKERDKEKYRHKGTRQTTVKTVYGEVMYERVVYQVTEEDGSKRFVYLLDETLELGRVGLVSTNMAQLLVKGITELSYRGCAKEVSRLTGQTISAMGVWNVIQALGEKICEEEKALVEEHKKGHVRGEKEVPVLFEEADGVYVNLQEEERKETGKKTEKKRKKKAEIKVGIAYDGWKQTGKERYELQDKVVVAGISGAREFQEYREASIAERYNLDEVGQRVLNADGAAWTRKVKDGSTCFQLDPFHRNQAVRKKIHDRRAVRTILELLETERLEELIRYYGENREGLLPYQSRGLKLPEHPEGLEYKNMGTMENHV